jgi:hypothetical protein
MGHEPYSFDKSVPFGFHRRYKKDGTAKTAFVELKSEMCSECFSDLKNHSIRDRRKCAL